MSNKKTYNGWTNYETWLVKLWIDNDEGSQNYWQEQSRDTYEAAEADQTFSKTERATLDLMAQLKDWHEEVVSQSTDRQNGFVVDLLNAAMSEVNWHEIAASLIEDHVEETNQVE